MTQPHIGPLLFSNFVWLTMNMSNLVLNFAITFFLYFVPFIAAAFSYENHQNVQFHVEFEISIFYAQFNLKMIFVKTWTIHKRKASWTTMSEKYSRLLSLFHQAGWYNMFTWTWIAKKSCKMSNISIFSLKNIHHCLEISGSIYQQKNSHAGFNEEFICLSLLQIQHGDLFNEFQPFNSVSLSSVYFEKSLTNWHFKHETYDS